MAEIMEQYGSVLLQIAGGAGMMALIWRLFAPDGALYNVLLAFMQSICG